MQARPDWSAAVSKGALIGGAGFVEIDKTAPGDPGATRE